MAVELNLHIALISRQELIKNWTLSSEILYERIRYIYTCKFCKNIIWNQQLKPLRRLETLRNLNNNNILCVYYKL